MLGSPQQYRSAHATNRMEILNVEISKAHWMLALASRILIVPLSLVQLFHTIASVFLLSCVWNGTYIWKAFGIEWTQILARHKDFFQFYFFLLDNMANFSCILQLALQVALFVNTFYPGRCQWWMLSFECWMLSVELFSAMPAIVNCTMLSCQRL